MPLVTIVTQWSYRSQLFVTLHRDVIMSTIASQITSLAIVYWTIYSGADQRKHQSSVSLTFMWGIHQWPVSSPHKWPVKRKMFPFDDVIIISHTAVSRWIVRGLIPISQNPLLHLFHIPQCSTPSKHICSAWSTVGYATGAFWDLRIRSIRGASHIHLPRVKILERSVVEKRRGELEKTSRSELPHRRHLDDGSFVRLPRR